MSDRTPADGTSPTAQRTAGLAAGLGFLLLISGVFFTGSGWIILNNVIVGAIVAIAAAYTAAVPSGGRLPRFAAPAVVVLAGLWAIASPFVLGVGQGLLFWATVVLGVLVAVLAMVSIYGSSQEAGQTTADVSS
ncbi:SPW repeat protein [Natrarchaeobius sp. A-rgal3]|uniref:SPW repeat domain-containing protein n=1 Tax=Natrarchaeobius versutus TaxID=1679078 RepID=UPI00351052D5